MSIAGATERIGLARQAGGELSGRPATVYSGVT